MKVVGETDLSGITRIVINRRAVWVRERVDDPNPYYVSYQWRKTSGGPGVKAFSENHIRSPASMMAHVNRLLAMGTLIETRQITKKGEILGTIQQSLAYRYWRHDETLNVVRKDLP
jgi:hypothetical protein